MLHNVGEQIIDNDIKTESSKRYALIFIQRVNINEEGSEGQKRRTRTGVVKV